MNLRIFLQGVLIGSGLLAATFVSKAEEACPAPSPAKKDAIRQYVIKRMRIPSESQVTLVSDQQANNQCFWKLDFQITARPTLAKGQDRKRQNEGEAREEYAVMETPFTLSSPTSRRKNGREVTRLRTEDLRPMGGSSFT